MVSGRSSPPFHSFERQAGGCYLGAAPVTDTYHPLTAQGDNRRKQ